MPPTKGVPTKTQWTQNSSLPADFVAAGAFDQAMAMLNKQIGVVNFEPFKPYFMQVYAQGSVSMTAMPNVHGLPCVSRSLSPLAPSSASRCSARLLLPLLPVAQPACPHLCFYFFRGLCVDGS